MIFTIIGVISSILVIVSYHYLLTGAWKATSSKYLYYNLASLILMIISLLHNFNLGAMIVQVFLLGVTLRAIITRH